MKKLLNGSAVIVFALSGCVKVSTTPFPSTNDDAAAVVRACASDEVLQKQLSQIEGFRASRDSIETFIRNTIEGSTHGKILPAETTIQINVVVNVLYRTVAENISLAQIQSQIDVLNEDFSATNKDHPLVPPGFLPFTGGNTNIRFTLANVVRRSTTIQRWSTNDAMKRTATGGINATSPANRLNIWVVNSMGATMGYSQFPGGPVATDGVVIVHKYFGRTGTVTAPFNKGRTVTHEVGHWLNLLHLWGSGTCGSDMVADTPEQNGANFNCPAFPKYSTCGSRSAMMTMNYMDYTNDACMYTFSAGQRVRMQAIFKPGGPRNTFFK